jgi:hypothetical protein
VVNPNVFKDLISHSRPISNGGGVLVYEVPISRVHCRNRSDGIVLRAPMGAIARHSIVVPTPVSDAESPCAAA